ncbi:MAG: FAD-dependent oxidoreductase, partial [Promethearchaeati archaeon]
MATTEKPRIGVFVCHCGHNIAGVVDVEEVAKNAGNLPNVIYSTHEMFMCSDAGQRLIKDMIDEHDLNRIVVASCSPRMHETTFRRVIEEADLNRYLFEQVNLREHVSWCHMNQPQKATQKAKDLVRMSVARAAKLESLPIKTVDVTPQTLVLGGGIAGLRAALDIADRGFKVVLVERNEQLGGHVAEWSTLFLTMEEASDVINPMVKRTKENPNIIVFTNSEVVE